jgi:hypothetical protein
MTNKMYSEQKERHENGGSRLNHESMAYGFEPLWWRNEATVPALLSMRLSYKNKHH